MGVVKLEDGKEVPDRRVNGNRLKLDVADWIKLFITILTTFAIITFGAGKLLTIVNNHTEVLAGQEKEIKGHSQDIAQTKNDIVNIKENLIYIRNKIDTIVSKMK